MDIAERLVNNVVKTVYEDLSPEAVNKAKLNMLDTIGCLIAGAAAPGCDAVRDQVLDWGGKEESTIMIYGGKAPCPHAALVNSTMARAMDFDCVLMGGLHMGAAAVPTALAVAELKGGVTGRAFLAAMLAGEDLAARVHMATLNYDGFEPTGVCGVMGLAAMAGKLLGLDENRLMDALGIALNHAAGSFQPNIDGGLVVRVMEGFASKAGIESAMLAKRGITGRGNIFQGVYGYFHLFSKDQYDGTILTEGLGEEYFGGTDTFVKKYPAGGITASAIEVVIQLVTEHDIRPEQVEEITVDCNTFCYNVGGHPFQIRTDAQVDAQFSYAYTVATAVVRRRFVLEDITPEAVADPEVLDVAGKVKPRLDDHARMVNIRLTDGRVFAGQMEAARGSKQNPMDREEIIGKYRSCVDFAGLRPLKDRTDRIIALIDELEDIKDISELIELLVV
jgi:2-methylcitrate dehydratase PrpD